MNARVSTFFKEFEDEIVKYRKHVDSVLLKYAQDKQEAIDTLNEKALKPRLELLKGVAGVEIETEYIKVHHDWFDCYAHLLRDAIWHHVKQEPPKAALDRLRLYSEFGIPMTKTDASYFLHELSGTHTGVVALAAVAKKSGLNIKAPDISQYERDVEEIGQSVVHLSRYCPDGHWQDWGELNVETTNIDSTAFDPNRPGHRGLARAQNDEIIPNLQRIAQRWSTNFIPELIDDAAMNDEEREQAEQEHAEALEAAADQIEIDDNANIRFAAELGKQKTAAREQAIAVMSAYSNGSIGTENYR